jgi:hypothetical protein
MGRKRSGSSVSDVRTVYELSHVRRFAPGVEIANHSTAYDEAERFEAEADYEALARQARSEVGTECAASTVGGQKARGIVDRIVIELRSRKVGAWLSPSRPMSCEVLLDESRLAPRASAVRDGLLAVPAGRRGALFAEALVAVGTPGPVGRESQHGRVCAKHQRWVGRGQLHDPCWSHVWRAEDPSREGG